MEKCLKLKHKQLKQILRNENVPLVTRLKTKQQMCEVLVHDTNYFQREEQEINDLVNEIENAILEEQEQNDLVNEIENGIAAQENDEIDDIINAFKNNTNISDDLSISIMRAAANKIIDPRKLVEFCTNKSMKELCMDEKFWKSVFQRDFGDREYAKRANVTWQELYKDFVEYPYEITLYTGRPFAAIYSRGTPMENKLSTFASSKIRSNTKAKIYQNKIIKGKRVNIVWARNHSPDQIIFTDENDIGDYIKSIGGKLDTTHYSNFAYNCTNGRPCPDIRIARI